MAAVTVHSYFGFQENKGARRLFFRLFLEPEKEICAPLSFLCPNTCPSGKAPFSGGHGAECGPSQGDLNGRRAPTGRRSDPKGRKLLTLGTKAGEETEVGGQ